MLVMMMIIISKIINYLENIKNNLKIEEELEFIDLNDSAYKQLINKRIEIEL